MNTKCKKKYYKMGGYYTVEAAFVMTICIWVLMALVYSGLYLHDQMLVKSEMNEMLAEHFQKGEGENTSEWRRGIENSLDDKLFLMSIQGLKVKKSLFSVDMTIDYELPISLSRLKHIFTKGKPVVSLTATYELVRPAKYKWDYDLRKKKGDK